MRQRRRALARIAVLVLVWPACQRGTSPVAVPVPMERQAPAPRERIASSPPRASAELPEPPPGPGSRIFASLRRLERKTASATVRITWLGDSHTAADFWTGEIRRQLQARFGDGGAGFVPFALGSRRHEVASFKVNGTWRQEPKSGASRHRQLDGQFGLAGRRIHGFPGASIDVSGGHAAKARWSFIYRIEPSQSPAPLFELSDADGAVSFTDTAFDGFRVAAFEHDAALGPVSLDIRRGQFTFFGVVVEHERPGVTLDALGINGARLRTLQAWDVSAWSRQLAWRQSDLVVLAYGTNESGDGGDMGRYEADYAAVVERVRAVGADCMLIGPTDRQSPDGQTLPEVERLDANQRAWAESLGCLYFSAFSAMGGRGGYDAWRQAKPQLAGTDGVHLTIAGYRYLADAWVRSFLARYDAHE